MGCELPLKNTHIILNGPSNQSFCVCENKGDSMVVVESIMSTSK